MRRFSNLFIFIFQFLIFSLFVSCDNPLFIGVTGLYKVDFATNGGSSVESVRTDCIKTSPFTSRTDHSFMGWYKSSDFSGTAVRFPLDISSDTTLYAKWQQQFTVSFECNGGDAIESLPVEAIWNPIFMILPISSR